MEISGKFMYNRRNDIKNKVQNFIERLIEMSKYIYM